ncbi:SusF/SusE family outer membrane protein [Mediterranea massiliensis]|uniref:SusF/SusE family outer membrane protein n=1 Tax=Mediterranea massiliensis TaxID=1841865 RepID=UPI00266B625D|nr:SusF/SusE family outer membrane protein [Mediterranea massiliensis]
MKKKALYCLFLLVLTFVGCKGDYTDWAAQQGFEQEEGRNVSLSAVAVDPINMADVTADSIVLFTPSVTMGESDVVSSYELLLEGTYNLPVSLEGKANVSELTDAVVSLFGQAPVERTISSSLSAFISAGESVMKATTSIELKVTLSVDFTEFIYLPGNHQGWNTSNAPALRSLNFDGLYTGFSYLDGDFKFNKSRDASWADGEYNYNDFSVFSPEITLGEGTNFNVATPAFYYIAANVATGELTVTATNWGIIGDATSGGWDTDTPLTYNAADATWTVTTDLIAGKFKFRANNDWAINLGGDINNLTQNGSDIVVEEAGNYTITVYMTRSTSDNIYCSLTKN